jgi:hypothetical protein
MACRPKAAVRNLSRDRRGTAALGLGRLNRREGGGRDEAGEFEELEPDRAAGRLGELSVGKADAPQAR